ncbi:excinuclease ABC subunit UvrC [Candidatus Woesearchaeota archaeon]|nr:excinuclease ABC subunit UvrC [Candidatus Woesearchaeota archaeon]
MIDYKSLPTSTGCYLFKNDSGSVIYVGKAKNIKKRVSSYFTKTKHDAKTELMIPKIRSVDFFITSNEAEALLLESNLIRKRKPKYNLELKDGIRYAYIKITSEAYPRLVITRHVTKKGKYFGPYTSGQARREIINYARKTFKIRACNNMPRKECLLYHLEQCSAPCTSKISKKDYEKNVKDLMRFLKGDTYSLIKDLEIEMKKYSDKQLFEEAKKVRNQVSSIKFLGEKQKVERVSRHDEDYVVRVVEKSKTAIFVFNASKGVIVSKKFYEFEDQEDLYESFIKLYYSKHSIPQKIIIQKKLGDQENIEEYLSNIAGRQAEILIPKKGVRKQLLELAKQNALLQFDLENKTLLELQKNLRLYTTPSVIDSFDISTSSGEDTVGSVVRYVNLKPDKSEYRSFNIRSVFGVDDFRSMYEAVFRRYKSIISDEKRSLPDLILIDGGPQQLAFAMRALKEHNLRIPVISLAKREEEVYAPGLKKPLNIKKNSDSLRALQKIRDEAHRFAVTRHRKKRLKKLSVSELDEISGVGIKTKQDLLTRFGSVKKIKELIRTKKTSKLEEMISKKVFLKLKNYFKK